MKKLGKIVIWIYLLAAIGFLYLLCSCSKETTIIEEQELYCVCTETITEDRENNQGILVTNILISEKEVGCIDPQEKTLIESGDKYSRWREVRCAILN